jgi:hypothetical protein
MIGRVAEAGKPAFQLRKGEQGLSVFDLDRVDPPLNDGEILASFRPNGGLQIVPVLGDEVLPERLRHAHCEVRPGPGMSRAAFNGISKSLNNMRTQTTIGLPSELIDLIRGFPVERQVEHCGQRFSVPSLEIYARCPRCGEQIKLRSFSAVTEIEDVFDAFLEWMQREGADEVIRRRQAETLAESDE